jgi:Flp pilus assembly pilin Flp
MLATEPEELMSDISRRIWIKLIDERGASMVEYALLIALIAIAALVGVALFGTSLRGSFVGSTQEIVDATS